MTSMPAAVPILLVLFAALTVPVTAFAGDSPIFLIGDWGIGEIDNRIMFYAGKDRFIDTPIPAPPSGPRWEVGYRALPFLFVGASAFFAYRELRRRAVRRTRGGFEIRPPAPSGSDH